MGDPEDKATLTKIFFDGKKNLCQEKKKLRQEKKWLIKKILASEKISESVRYKLGWVELGEVSYVE